MQVDEQAQQQEPQQAVQAKPATETLLSALAPVAQLEEEDDDPAVIFLRAVAEISTQPLPKQPQAVNWPFVLFTIAFFCSFLGGTVLAIMTSPTVMIELTPLSKTATSTTQLALPTRTLAPVTLAKAATAPTTGNGHQAARAATGVLTVYNGANSAQTIAVGTVFTGNDRIQVITNQPVTIPAANLPQVGQASVAATAIRPGSHGNIAPDDITVALSSDLTVKNDSSFHGGRDARDYRAVAQSDLDRLTAQLRQRLSQQIPQAFVVRSGEAVQVTACTFTAIPNHRRGEEAQSVSIAARDTCKGVAYNTDQLTTQATSTFTAQTRPGANYQLIGPVSTRIVTVSPVTVMCSGYWVYTLSQDYEQYLAQEIAGDSPQQARKYLLDTGVLTQATVPGTLPRDSGHIRFQVVVGG